MIKSKSGEISDEVATGVRRKALLISKITQKLGERVAEIPLDFADSKRPKNLSQLSSYLYVFHLSESDHEDNDLRMGASGRYKAICSMWRYSTVRTGQNVATTSGLKVKFGIALSEIEGVSLS